MPSKRLIQLISSVAMIACLCGAVMLGGPIRQQRDELKLTYNPTAQQAIPPKIMLAQAALGSFRGVFVDFLWYRANQSKQAGQYREALQLSQWICHLQPRFEKVWTFRAWDMAYNISVATHTLEERWHWVNKGINLLRNEGIRANPRSVVIKKELAWIFFHKIGGISDDAHWYYRRKLAEEWQQVLGSPEGMTTEGVIERISDIANAPERLDELRTDADAAKLIDHLATLGYEPDVQLLREIGRILMFFQASKDRIFIRLVPEHIAQKLDLRLRDAMQDPELAKGFFRLVPYLRRKVLIEHYHMDPQYMHQLMAPSEPGEPEQEAGYGLGPMDWRHPAAHGAYWAAQGIETAKEAPDKRDVDQLNTDRLIIHSMQDLARFGRLHFDPVSGYLDMMPDPRFIESYRRALGYGTERAKSGEFPKSVESNYDDGYENFLLQAIAWCYLYGEQANAKHYWLLWRERFRDKPHNKDRIRLDLNSLVTREMRENPMYSNIRQFVDAMIRHALLHGLAQGDQAVYNRYLRVAKEAYDAYENPLSPTKISPDRKRIGLPKLWPEMVSETYVQLMRNSRIHLASRARIWISTVDINPSLARRVYDKIRPTMISDAEAMGYDPDRVLPEPAGMAQYRQQHPQTPDEADQDTSSRVERQ